LASKSGYSCNKFLQGLLGQSILRWRPAILELANFRSAGGDVMRSFVIEAATFLIVATAAFSQEPSVPAATRDASQKDEPQILQLEAEMLKGEMNSDPVTASCCRPARG
jgi:hypothetical protein